jgi:hypothetical protein
MDVGGKESGVFFHMAVPAVVCREEQPVPQRDVRQTRTAQGDERRERGELSLFPQCFIGKLFLIQNGKLCNELGIFHTISIAES